MHFFYFDEAGCTGADLNNAEQRVFVLGGLSTKDQGWHKTVDSFRSILQSAIGDLPPGFELHSTDLLNRKNAFQHLSLMK
ncbi:DUF3800 domain-containing protein [Palleronia salina]|uniref:DUF3800 domain-containing protein n=1 Tax=Palleronia salina TaxID=313368 RepID=UPI00093522BA|nr:DUF3800 domain-containing protein [Palleronia salina]